MRKDYVQSWESVNKQMNEDADFGKVLNSSGFIEDTVKILCNNVSTDLEKVNKIYTYVQKRFKWNGHHTIYATRGLKKPFI